MNYKEKLAAALKRAQQLNGLVGERDLTEDEITEVKSLGDEINGLAAKIKAADEATAMLAGLSTPEASFGATGPDGTDFTKSGGLGDRFLATESFKAWQKSNPSGIGDGTPMRVESKSMGSMRDLVRGSKADTSLLTGPMGFAVPERMATVDNTVNPQLTLLDFITLGATSQNAIQYLQITSVTRGAAVVPEATSATSDASLKPKSALSTNLVTEAVATYADGIDATNQLLADAPALATFMNSVLEYNVRNKIQDRLINGTGLNGDPTGILHTTGVQEQGPVDPNGESVASGSGDIFKGVRSAITKVTKIGGVVSGVLLSPEDDERWDTERNQVGAFYSGGPFASGPNTAWGRPRAVCNALETGQFITGDLKTIALLQREGLSVTAFNQHKDYAQRNLVYVRAELRAAQAIWKPAFLVVGEL